MLFRSVFAASAFGAQPLLPDLALQMIEVGEQAGELDRMLLKVAEVFDVEAKRGIDRLLAALVPSLTVVMAVLVAVLSVGVLWGVTELFFGMTWGGPMKHAFAGALALTVPFVEQGI